MPIWNDDEGIEGNCETCGKLCENLPGMRHLCPEHEQEELDREAQEDQVEED